MTQIVIPSRNTKYELRNTSMEGMQLVAEDYSTADIIKAIQKCDTLFRTDTAKIAKTLKRSTELQTVKAVFDFLLSRVKYKLDVQGVQLARRPNRTLQEGRGDCKSFSLLAGSLLYNLGTDYSYRFVSYRPDPTPTHVYVVAHTKTGNVLVDGVWKIFNSEKPYRTKTDIRMKGLYIGEDVGAMRKRRFRKTPRHYYRKRRMGEVAINGLDDVTPINGIGKRGKRGGFFKKARAKVKAKVQKAKAKVKARVQKVGKGIKKIAKKAGGLAKKGFNLLKKGALAAPRNAFLLLVKVNFRGFASKLAKSDQAALASLWEKAGGKFSALQQTINSSKNKKRILGIGATIYTPLGGIGGIGAVTVASAMASAAPIIALLKKFLGKGATDDASPDEQTEGENLAQSLNSDSETPEQLERASTKTLQTKSGESVEAPDIEQQSNEVQEYKATRSGSRPKPKAKPTESDEETETSPNSDSGMSTGMKVGLGVAAAAAVYLVTKKK